MNSGQFMFLFTSFKNDGKLNILYNQDGYPNKLLNIF